MENRIAKAKARTPRKSIDKAAEAIDWNPQGQRWIGRPWEMCRRSLERELTAGHTIFVDVLCATINIGGLLNCEILNNIIVLTIFLGKLKSSQHKHALS